MCLNIEKVAASWGFVFGHNLPLRAILSPVLAKPLFPFLFSHSLFGVTILAHMVSELTQPRDSGPDTF